MFIERQLDASAMLTRSRAPLRLGFAGGGSDTEPFCSRYGGMVLNATIDLYAHCTLEASSDGRVHFVASDMHVAESHDAATAVPTTGQLSLHAGVYNHIVARYNDAKPLAVTVTTHCDAPPGSGLGSSSTLVVAMVRAYAEHLNLPFGEYDTARVAYEIERNELALEGGKQDQYAAAFGGFNFMEFSSNGHALVNPLRVRSWIVSELESSLVLFYTGRSRESAAIIAEQAKNVNSNNDASIGAMAQAKLDALAMKEWLLRGNVREFGRVMESAWHNKKRMATSITNERLERFYNVASSAGAYAGKVSGAGGGGFMMFLVDVKDRLQVVHALTELREGTVLGCHFTTNGAEAWRV